MAIDNNARSIIRGYMEKYVANVSPALADKLESLGVHVDLKTPISGKRSADVEVTYPTKEEEAELLESLELI